MVRVCRATLLHQAGDGGASGRSRGLPAAHWYSATATHRERESYPAGMGGSGVGGEDGGIERGRMETVGWRLEEEVGK